MRLFENAIRRLLGPAARVVRRYLDERFRESEQRIVDRVDRLAATGSSSAAILEVLTHLGQRLRQLTEETRRQGVRLDALERSLRDPGPGPAAWPATHPAPSALDYERVLELTYVHGAISGLPRDARIGVVEETESPIPAYLASLGFRVTPMMSNDAAMKRPDRPSVGEFLAAWSTTPLRFDAIVAHVPIEVVERLVEFAAPHAILVVIAPFDRFIADGAPHEALESAIARKLRGWTVRELEFACRPRETNWILGAPREEAAACAAAGAPAIALLTARRSDAGPSGDA